MSPSLENKYWRTRAEEIRLIRQGCANTIPGDWNDPRAPKLVPTKDTIKKKARQ